MKKTLIVLALVILLIAAALGIFLTFLIDGDSPVFHRGNPAPVKLFFIAAKINQERQFLSNEKPLPAKRRFSLTEDEFNTLSASSPFLTSFLPQNAAELKNVMLTLQNGIFHVTYAKKLSFSSGKYVNLSADFRFEYEDSQGKITILSARAGKIPVPRESVQNAVEKELRKHLSNPDVKALLIKVKAENGNFIIHYHPQTLEQLIRKR